MSSALYDKGRQKFLEGSIAWLSDTIKAILVDVTQYGIQISGATNASPIVITTASSHGLSTGDVVTILNVAGNTAANGLWSVTVVNATQFSLDGSTGNGSYTSGGRVVKLSRDEFLSDVPSGARLATATLSGKTSALGVAGASDATFTPATGNTVHGMILYKDTGSESTSPLIAWIDQVTGFPLSTNGSTVLIQMPTGAYKIFKL
jgi:hypothetical protein